MNITLKGEEVELAPLAVELAADLAQAATESREHYELTVVPDGVEATRAYIRAALSTRNRYAFVIRFKGRVVGTTSYLDMHTWKWPSGSPLQRSGEPDVLEIGSTWLASSAQRTRCNTECKYLLLEYAFETWKVHRVTLKTDARNSRSRRAIERIGAIFEGIRRAERPATDGTIRDSAYYSIILSEWPAVKASLQAKLARSV